MNMVLKGCFSAFEDGSAEWTCTARRRDGMFVTFIQTEVLLVRLGY